MWAPELTGGGLMRSSEKITGNPSQHDMVTRIDQPTHLVALFLVRQV